jgi:hypothetical protein
MWSNFTNNSFNKLKIKRSNKNFINKIKELRSNILKLPDVNYNLSLVNIDDNILNNLKSSYWVSDKLCFKDLSYDVNIKWNNNNIYIKTTKEKFNEFAKRISFFLKIINYINQDNNEINIYMVLSNLKKYIDPNDIISVNNVNSGYTDLLRKVIFIWREEEFEKVCFHEIIHLLDQDHRNENIDYQTNIDGPTSYHEAITDFKGIIFNLIYLSLVTKIKINLLFEYEYSFIKNQAKYINYYLNKFNKQESPAYSYYVLKYFIFTYFNSNNFDEKLFNQIINENISYKLLINKITNYSIRNYKFINFNSARMTLFELK